MATQSLFTTQTPASNDQNDGTSTVLGTTITFSVAGVVRGIRFRAPVTATGTYEGALYQVNNGDASPSGTLISEIVTFGTLTSNDWNVVNFTVPVNVSTGTAYRAVVRTSQGRYTFTSNFFATALTNNRITGIQDNTNPVGVGALRNGVFAVSGSMVYPSNTFGSTSYFVDVVYEEGITAQTIFTTQVPATTNGNDSTPYVLGTAFTSDINATVTAGKIRAPVTVTSGASFIAILYQMTSNTTGTELARKQFTGLTASSWNYAFFNTPVSITAGNYYIIAYFTPDFFVATTNFFNTALTNGHLTAIQDTVPYDNGRIHINGDAFPEAGAANASCYFADVLVEINTFTNISDTETLSVTETEFIAISDIEQLSVTEAETISLTDADVIAFLESELIALNDTDTWTFNEAEALELTDSESWTFVDGGAISATLSDSDILAINDLESLQTGQAAIPDITIRTGPLQLTVRTGPITLTIRT